MFTDQQFTNLVNAYIDTVFRVALNYLRNPTEAEDVTQNVFEKLLRQAKAFESQEHIRNWLIRVTINECRQILRAPWRRHENLDDYAEKLSFETPRESGLFTAVMGLPQKYRVAIYLYYYEGYSTKEIAMLLRIPQGTVCTNLKRGRELLKNQLEVDDYV